jgi:hypothetical protein
MWTSLLEELMGETEETGRKMDANLKKKKKGAEARG